MDLCVGSGQNLDIQLRWICQYGCLYEAFCVYAISTKTSYAGPYYDQHGQTGGCGILEGTIAWLWHHGRQNSHAKMMSTCLSSSGICPLVVVFLFIYYLFCVTNLISLRKPI